MAKSLGEFGWVARHEVPRHWRCPVCDRIHSDPEGLRKHLSKEKYHSDAYLWWWGTRES